jgi:hypothetical protein
MLAEQLSKARVFLKVHRARAARTGALSPTQEEWCPCDDYRARLSRRLALGTVARTPPRLVSSQEMEGPRQLFRRDVERALATLPLQTPAGQVLPERREVDFGYPGGNHESTICWVYRRTGASVDVLFAFYKNFTDDDLLCKVVTRGQIPPVGSGASVQFHGEKSVTLCRTGPTLAHTGDVTVGVRLTRRDLDEGLRMAAPEAMSAFIAGRAPTSDWPRVIGSTDDVPGLIDRLGCYAYAVEQVKRARRGEDPFPPFIVVDATASG